MDIVISDFLVRWYVAAYAAPLGQFEEGGLGDWTDQAVGAV